MKVSHASEAAEGGFADIIAQVRDALRRRWLTLLLVTLGVFAVGAVLITLMKPQYTSVAHVRIDPSRTPVTGDQQADSQALSPEALETEVSLIHSDEIARRVVAGLGLAHDPELAKGLDGGSEPRLTPGDREDAVAGNLLKRLSVSRDKLSYILGIAYTSGNRLASARIANAFADAYLFSKVGAKADSAGKKAIFLRQQVNSLAADIRRSENQLASYQATAGLTQGAAFGGGTIVDQQISPLSAQLAEAKSEAAAARASTQSARQEAAKGGSDTVGEVLASPVIGQLRAQRAQVLQQMTDVGARYGDKHPDVIRMRGQLTDIDSQLQAETTRITASLQSKADAANAKASSLQGSMNELAGRQAINTRAGVLATSLTAEIQSKRAQYDKLAQAALEATQAANNSIAQAEIVDRATAPSRPTSPNKILFGALALIVAFASGGATVAVQEMMSVGFRSVDDVETRLGIPMLAAIPKVKGAKPADLLLDKPTSLYSESLRIARASILGVGSGQSLKVIAITSALPSEGKTTTALSLARALAINGQKTLLIDCDVRRALMRQSVRNAPSDGPGIVEVLHGEASIDEAIGPGDLPNLDHMLVRASYFSAENLFGDGQMQRMLDELRKRYELIVLDLPPLMGLADGRFLAALADVVALVVRWNATPINAASSALQGIQADANVAGVIFTMVDTGAEAVGGFYYSKQYSSYYQNA